MSPRFVLTLVAVLSLPLMTGACGVPLAVTGASYAADGGLAVTTRKTSTDHFLSMVSKEDCSTWRIFRHQPVCKDRDPNAPDPYKVDYEEPFRSQSEGGGVQYGTPLRAKTDAPATSWDAAAYKPATPAATNTPTTAVAEVAPPDAAAAMPQTAPSSQAQPAAAVTPQAKKKPAGRAKAKKPSPSQVASAR